MQDELNIKFEPKVWQESKVILKQYVNSVIEEYKNRRNKTIDALNLDDEHNQLKNSFNVNMCSIDELMLIAEKKSIVKEDKLEVKYMRRSWQISIISLIVSVVSIVLSAIIGILSVIVGIISKSN